MVLNYVLEVDVNISRAFVLVWLSVFITIDVLFILLLFMKESGTTVPLVTPNSFPGGREYTLLISETTIGVEHKE